MPNLAVALVACVASSAAAAPGGRYLAVFADGRRVEGRRLSGWEIHPGSPRLDATELLDARRPLRWFCDRRAPAYEAADNAAGYVEFVGGDRLAGRVVGAEVPAPGAEEHQPPSLWVRPLVSPDLPPRQKRALLRVLAADVRRVVWGRRPGRRYQPATAFLLDGEELPFRRLRWADDGVRLLLEDSIRRVALPDLAELHLPARDPWEVYFRHLAVLSPDLSAPLIRLETTTGLVLTGSMDRFQATRVGEPNTPSNWYHLVQPAWSPEPIWVPFRTIRMRWHIAPHEVPLTWADPCRAVQRSTIGYPWPWRRNRSVQGGRLIAGGRPAGWGLGVHARSELTFELPPFATSFRARVGLDLIAGRGGSARGLVHLDSAEAKPLFRSPVLVGCDRVVDTGELKLPGAPGRPKRLVLVADAAHGDRPGGADPFDIRDELDWVEPIVRLDRAGLQAAVLRHAAAAIPAWRGWTVAGGGGAAIQTAWDTTDPARPRFVSVAAAGGKPLTLTSRRRIGEAQRWLKLCVRQIGQPAAPGWVEVRIDRRLVGRAPVSGGGADVAQPANMPENLARRATVSASAEFSARYRAHRAVDGRIPRAMSKLDVDRAWVVQGAGPAELRLQWPEPVLVAEVVYYGRTAVTWTENWKDYELYLDGSASPAAKGRFLAGHGPQRIRLAKPTRARRITLKFLNSYGGTNAGASEVQVFSTSPPSAALGRFIAPSQLSSGVDGRPAGVARPMDRPCLVDLAAYRGREASLEVTYTPGEAGERTEWPVLALVPRATRVHWVPLRILAAASQNGAAMTVQPDGSIRVTEGPRRVDRNVDTYVVRAATGLARITAVRLEALPDSALPGGGPGRGDGRGIGDGLGKGDGNFVLSQFRLRTLPVRRGAIRGRTVRVELGGPNRAISLAEVQVFGAAPEEAALREQLRKPQPAARWVPRGYRAGEVLALLETPAARRDLAWRTRHRAYLDAVCENLARGGRASQSSTMGSFTAGMAIDGRLGVGFTHTSQGPQETSWWQVDLGAARPIDRIVLWNRIDLGATGRLKDFTVSVLDEGGRVVWQRRGIADPPVPAVELFDSDARDVPFRSAVASFAQVGNEVAESLEPTPAGWGVRPWFGEPHAAVFVLEKPIDARGCGLQFEMKYAFERSLRALGRFRLLATADPPPVEAEPVATVIGPASGPPAAVAAAPLTSPHAVFEDDGLFVAAGAGAPRTAALVSDDRHAGLRAVRIAPGGSWRLDLGRFVPIRARPGEGQFRYIRFAFRKRGGGRVALTLEHASSTRRACRYEAGSGTPTGDGARSVWALALPAEWIVMDRDVFGDFGRLDLTGLSVSCTPDGPVVLDHVYLARTRGDFLRLPPAPSPEETNLKARLVLARPVLDRGLPAVVSFDLDGRRGTGVLVGGEGYVLTAGHLVVRAGRKVTVRLPGGREVRGVTAGVSRETDLGLIRISEKGPWKGLELSGAETWQPGRLYVGFSFSASPKGAEAPVTYIAGIAAVGQRTVRTDFRLTDRAAGGPLLDAAGRIVGIHTGDGGLGNLVFSKTRAAGEDWKRLTAKEVWGRWMPGTGPMMGFHSTGTGQGCHITHVYAGTPAAASGMRAGDTLVKVDGQPVLDFHQVGRILAEKEPGNTVVALVRRGERQIQLTIGLMSRRRLVLPAPKAPRPR